MIKIKNLLLYILLSVGIYSISGVCCCKNKNKTPNDSWKTQIKESEEEEEKKEEKKEKVEENAEDKEIKEYKEKIKEFRETCNIGEKDYSDEKILDILKKCDYDVGTALNELLNN